MSDRGLFWRVYPTSGEEKVLNVDYIRNVTFSKPLEEMGDEPWEGDIVVHMVGGHKVTLKDTKQKRIMIEDILNKASKPAKYFDDAPKPSPATIHRRKQRLDGEGTRVRPGETSYLVEEFSGTPSDLATRLSRYGGEGWKMVTVEDKYLVEDWEESGLSESKYFWRLVMSKTLVRER